MKCVLGAALTAGLLAANVLPTFPRSTDVTGKLPSEAPLLSARILGVVFDSVAMRPLARALVQLVALNDSNRIRSTRTDGSGAYVLDSVPLGAYMLGFLHDRLDTLGIESPLRRIDVRLPQDITAQVSIPSAATLIGRRCGATPRGQLPTMFIGTVRSAYSAREASAARVRVAWNEVSVSPRGIQRRTPSHYVTAGGSGAFVFCGIPTDVPVVTRAFAGSDSSGVVELHAPRNGLLVRDLYIGQSSPTNARLRGAVRTANGDSIVGARLDVWGTKGAATSAGSGQFSMTNLPSGTYMLEVRALGFEPTRQAIDFTGNNEIIANISMTPLAPMVDTVRVRARANAPTVPAEFERRRKSGFGHFFDESQLTEKKAMYMADIFRSTPGMTVLPGSGAGDQVLMRSSGGGGACVPAVFLNGVTVTTTDGVLDTFLNPQEVRAVEIYTRTASVPLQFQSSNGCGSIVLWTGARRSSTPGR